MKGDFSVAMAPPGELYLHTYMLRDKAWFTKQCGEWVCTQKCLKFLIPLKHTHILKLLETLLIYTHTLTDSSTTHGGQNEYLSHHPKQ